MIKLVLIFFFLLNFPVIAQENYWLPTNWPSSSGYVYDIASDSSGRIYAATFDAGVFLTTDKGQTWTDLNVTTTNITCITLNKFNDIYIGTYGDGLYGSTDQGVTWNKYSLPASQINRVVLGIDQTIFVATFADSAVYRSDDNGKNWTVINKGIDFGTIPIGAPSIASGSDGEVYVITMSGKVYVSRDKGNNWTDIDFPLDNNPMTSDDNIITLLPISTGYVFVAGSGGVCRYKVDNKTWERINIGVQEPNIFVRVLAVTKEGYILRGSEYSYSGTVYLSTDNGDHWVNHSQGLPLEAIFGFAVDPEGNIFAANYGKGVFISNPSRTSLDYHKNGLLPDLELGQNYPNPFNPTTKIEYSIPQTSFVTIKVFDILGREVATLVNEEKRTGNYEVEFNGKELTSGIYFYKIQAGDFVNTRKMILLR
jgi:photosystem II stability/assembly factor-like uncharacterized protein